MNENPVKREDQKTKTNDSKPKKEPKTKRKHVRHSEEEKQKAIELVRSGLSYYAAAKKLGLHAPMVRKWFKAQADV